jgi:hypothetical protein
MNLVAAGHLLTDFVVQFSLRGCTNSFLSSHS